MKSYVVGGAVRDRLLGLPVSDRDHVVVGATVDEMLASGFRPVGRDFPVFLHPTTHEEYALARTERKTAPGYAGFVFHADAGVTLDEDLARRDLTVNAMAEDDAAGTIVDPFGGRADLDARVLRHVGPAFVEDPVRILRLARFAARFHAFRVADETMALARRMADAGEVDALVPERVWQELSRGLMEARPSRMLAVLDEAGALARLVPELYAGKARVADVAARLDRAADAGATLVVRFAILAQALPDAAALAAVAARFAVPAALRDVAAHAIREHDAILALDAGSTANEADAAERAVALFERTDAFRRPERFAELVESVRAASPAAPAGARIGQAVRAARAVDAAAIARAHPGQGARMPALLHAARVAAVASAFGTPDVAA